MNILVLGAGGMVGSMMVRYLSQQNHQVVGLYRKDFDPSRDPFPDFDSYDYVINCIGLIKQKSSDHNLLMAINSEFPQKLAKQCSSLIHISSDCVFSGNLPSGRAYSTTDPKDAQDSYGVSKAAGEPKNCMVLRTSVIGPASDASGLLEWFLCTDQNPVRGFSNHWWSGITTLELAKIANQIIDGNYHHNIFQIASGRISKYDLLCLINDIWELKKNILKCEDASMINRSLVPNIQAANIKQELQELRNFIRSNN